MDQLFALGHVCGATKILELARRGMTSGWFPAEKRAGLLTPVEIRTKAARAILATDILHLLLHGSR